MDEAKELKRYLRAPMFKGIVFLIAHAIFIIGMLGVLILGATGGAGVVIVFMLLFLIYRFVKIAFILGAAGQQIKKLNNEGKLESAVSDFRNARQYLHDRLRLGDTYVFGRRGGLLEYQDIVRVYRERERKSMTEVQMSIRAESKEFGTIDICEIKYGDTPEEVNEALQAFTSHNPDIVVGKE